MIHAFQVSMPLIQVYENYSPELKLSNTVSKGWTNFKSMQIKAKKCEQQQEVIDIVFPSGKFLGPFIENSLSFTFKRSIIMMN